MDVRVIFTLVVLVGAALADQGEYEPKSFYLLDSNGQKSDVVYVRDRRDLERKLQRIKRGVGNGGYSSSQSQSYSSSGSASSSSSSSSDGGTGMNNYASGYHPSAVLSELHNFASNFPAAGFTGIPNIGARSGGFSDTYGSSGYTNGPQTGYNPGMGAAQQTGYTGPILFSRSGEAEGSGIRASGAAAGPNAAFSSVSTSSGGGKVSYDVKSGKY